MRTVLVPVVTSLWSDVTYGVHETHCERIGQLSDLTIVIHLLSFGPPSELVFHRIILSIRTCLVNWLPSCKMPQF